MYRTSFYRYNAVRTYSTINFSVYLGIPPAETFAFVFNTLLNDIATHNMAWADRIIDAQVRKRAS
jgi:hypothetical protein